MTENCNEGASRATAHFAQGFNQLDGSGEGFAPRLACSCAHNCGREATWLWIVGNAEYLQPGVVSQHGQAFAIVRE